MATVQLVASSYTTSSASISVSNPSRAYTNASSSTYATVDPSSSTSLWADFYGFDFSQIPSGVDITSMTFKIKTQAAGYSSWSVHLRDTSENEIISNTELHSGSSTYTDTLTPTKTFSQIIALGNNFHFRIATGSSGDVFVYGMEVNVTYVTPVPNKVDYIKDGVLKTLIDLTGDDILPEDVTTGKTFHLATGEQAVGTGGGLEYETGTWSPSSNTTTAPTINFAKAHTEEPAMIAFADVSTSSRSTDYFISYTYTNLALLIPDWAMPSSGAWKSKYHYYVYASSSSAEQASTLSSANINVSNTSFTPYINSKRLRSGRVYNWIAIWT